MIRIFNGDCLTVLKSLPDESVDFCWTDPPFNTGKVQKRQYIRTVQSEDGDRVGFGGKTYTTEVTGESAFDDRFDSVEAYQEFLRPRLAEIWRILKPTGSIYLHLGQKWSPYVRVMLDQMWGVERHLNTLIWSYDFGARPKRYWARKHDEILIYVKDPESYYFSFDRVERIPYMAPDLVGPEKAERGKFPTSVHWCTIVPTNGAEKTGYATQKPITLVRRFVAASCPPGGICLDTFAGSGTLGMVAEELGSDSILIDQSIEAVQTMLKRFAGRDVRVQMESK